MDSVTSRQSQAEEQSLVFSAGESPVSLKVLVASRMLWGEGQSLVS
jgi:hypothetical protein